MFWLEAYILISCEATKVWDIAEEVLKIDGVKMAHAVTGQFDVVTYTEFSNMSELRKIIRKLHFIEGVLQTQTLTAIPSRINT